MSSHGMMRAIRCYAPHDYRCEEIPIPSIGPDEILTRVKITGICAGDSKAYEGAPRMWGGHGFAPYIEAPVVPGHEFVGEVVEVGAEAARRHDMAPGDLVVAEQIVPCGKCRYCQRGSYWMCDPHDVFGFKKNRVEGAWAEYMKYPPTARVYKLPREIPIHDLVMVEPLACAIHAIERADIQLGDVVVIAGLGPLGQCMVQVARLRNPGLLIGLDMRSHRLKLAGETGADLVLDPGKVDVVERVRQLTGGYGCDIYIEASGSAAAVVQGLQMIRKMGRFVEFSVMSAPTSVDWSVIGDEKELEIRGVSLSPYCYPKAIDLVRKGLVNMAPLVTHELPLEQAVDGLELVHEASESIKVALIP